MTGRKQTYTLAPYLNAKSLNCNPSIRRRNYSRILTASHLLTTSSATNKYTDEQKPCIATQITSNPLISFKPKEIIFSSANYGRPLNKKSWQINGEAEFENGSIKFTKDTIIAVKFVNQNWYFSLPNFYSKNWFDQKLSASDLTAELSHLLTVDKQPDCPIEISKVSVKINPEYNNLRKYTVEFTNKTEKTIKSFGYRIGKGLSVGGGTAIKPKESVQSIGNYGANLYFCENIERTKNIFVDFVRFSDGTEWRSKAKK